MEISNAILSGDTADVYFIRTKTILAREGIDPVVVMEIFPGRAGILCGVNEVVDLLRTAAPDAQVEALEEGAAMNAKQVVLRIRAHYSAFGLYETAMLGMLAHPSGGATAPQAAASLLSTIFSKTTRVRRPSCASRLAFHSLMAGCSPSTASA